MKSKATYILAISLGSAALSARAQLDDYGPPMLDAPPPDQPAAFAGFHRPLTLAAPDGQSGGGGSSQDEQEKLNEISKQLSNPVSSLWAMFTEVDLVAFDGDLNTGDVKLGSRMIFQPIMPFPLCGSGDKEWSSSRGRRYRSCPASRLRRASTT